MREVALLLNSGKPILVPFQCTDEDIRSAGLTCSEQDPCPVYLELAAVESTGIRIFAAGNIHTSNATLSTILLGTEDNGLTWREVHERVRGAGLDRLQFAGVETGWTSGLSFSPLPQDPFLLATTDGGKTWRSHAIFNETRFGSIQQFYFENKTSASLVIDHDPGSGEAREDHSAASRTSTTRPWPPPRATSWNIVRDRSGRRSPPSP